MITYAVLIRPEGGFVHFESLAWPDLTAMIAGGFSLVTLETDLKS